MCYELFRKAVTLLTVCYELFRKAQYFAGCMLRTVPKSAVLCWLYVTNCTKKRSTLLAVCYRLYRKAVTLLAERYELFRKVQYLAGCMLRNVPKSAVLCWLFVTDCTEKHSHFAGCTLRTVPKSAVPCWLYVTDCTEKRSTRLLYSTVCC